MLYMKFDKICRNANLYSVEFPLLCTTEHYRLWLA